jgi:hypothetical protein
MSAPLSECRLVGDHIRRSSTLIDIGGAILLMRSNTPHTGKPITT